MILPVGKFHNVKNPSATLPAKTLGFLIGEKGRPLASPAK
jgi:hypothetical protein